MTTGQWVLVAAVACAVAFGLVRVAVDGRFRGTHPVRGADQSPVDHPAALRALRDAGVDVTLGETATFVQFSSAFCAPCRATRRVLDSVVAADDRLAHVEVDAEHHLDLVRALGVLRTPTTLVLDAAGAEVSRATGAPTRAQVEASVAAL